MLDDKPVVLPPIPPSLIACPYRIFSAVCAALSAFSASDVRPAFDVGAWVLVADDEENWPLDFECGTCVVAITSS